jgi:hypothetical protein
MDSVSTARSELAKVKPAKPRRLGTHRARHVVDTKGKVLFARNFIHNSKIASAEKSHRKFFESGGDPVCVFRLESSVFAREGVQSRMPSVFHKSGRNVEYAGGVVRPVSWWPVS